MAEESQLFHGRVGGGNKWIYLKRNTEQETKIYDAQLSSHNKKYEESLKEQEAAIKASNKRIQKFKAEKNDKAVLLELKKLEQLNADKEKLVKDFENVKKTIREKSVRTAEIFEQNRYKSMTNREKKQYLKEVAERKQVELKSLKDKYAALEAEKQRLKNILRSDASDTEKEEASKSLKVVEKQLDKKSSLSKEIDEQSRFTKDAENIAKLFYDAFATRAEKAKDAAERYEKSEKRLAELRAEEINAKKEYDKLKKDARKNENKVDKDKLKTAKQNLKDAKKAVKDQEQINDEALSEKARAASEAEKDETEEEKNKKAAAKFASAVTAINDRISGFMTDIYGQQSRMKGRLQGSGVNWTGAVLDTTTTIGMTGVVNQKNVVEK